jgi:hypothetical protein
MFETTFLRMTPLTLPRLNALATGLERIVTKPRPRFQAIGF